MLFFVHMFLLLLSAIGKYGVILCSIPELLFTGSLIQHQLVTHLTLGIALRAVLDALRNPSLKNFISPEGLFFILSSD